MAITKECSDFLNNNFKLENYTKVDHIEFLNLLAARSYHFGKFQLIHEGERTVNLENIFNNPLDAGLSDFESKFVTSSSGDSFTPIRPLDLSDYLRVTNVIEASDINTSFQRSLRGSIKDTTDDSAVRPSWSDFIKKHQDEQGSLDFISEEAHEKIMRELSRSRDGQLLADFEVDLNFPDPVLVRAFKDWLEQNRSEKTGFTDGDLFVPWTKDSFKNDENLTDHANKFLDKVQDSDAMAYFDIRFAGWCFGCDLSPSEIGHYLYAPVKKAVGKPFSDKDRARTPSNHLDYLLNSRNIVMFRKIFHDL